MRYLIALLLAFAASPAQTPVDRFPSRKPGEPEEVRLPNGKLQKDEIVKAEHQKSLDDVDEMKKLILEFSDEFEKGGRHTVSIQMIRKLEDIEKRAKRIRTRLTRP